MEDLIVALSVTRQETTCRICGAELKITPVEFFTLEGRSWVVNLMICQHWLSKEKRRWVRPISRGYDAASNFNNRRWSLSIKFARSSNEFDSSNVIGK